MANTKTQNGYRRFITTGITVVNNDFTPLLSLDPGMDANEARSNFQIGASGTFSRLGFIQVSTPGGTATARFRKNTANGNEATTSTAGVDGWFFDTTNSDTVAKDDIIDIGWTFTVSSPSVSGSSILFDGGASGLVTLLCGPWTVTTFTGTTFSPLFSMGTIDFAGPEANCQHKIRAPGVISYFQIVSHAATNTAVTLTVRINGGDGNSTVTVPANSTGINIDTTHTDTLVSGNLVCLGSSALANGTFRFIYGACVTQSAGTYDFAGASFGTTVAAGATNKFASAKGFETGWSTVTTPFPMEYTNTGLGFKNARVQAVLNTYVSDVVWQFRKNNNPANNAVTVTAGVTGWFEDTTHTDDFADGDLFDYVFSGGTAGNLTLQTFAITVDNSGLTTPTIFSFDQMDTGFSRRLENIGY